MKQPRILDRLSAGHYTRMVVATRIALFQLFVGFAAGGIWWMAEGREAAAAAVAGGVASALISYYVAVKALGKRRQTSAAMLSDFYRAQAWKYVLAAVIFVLAIKLFGSQGFLPFITAYLASLSIYWFSLLWKV